MWLCIVIFHKQHTQPHTQVRERLTFGLLSVVSLKCVFVHSRIDPRVYQSCVVFFGRSTSDKKSIKKIKKEKKNLQGEEFAKPPRRVSQLSADKRSAEGEKPGQVSIDK